MMRRVLLFVAVVTVLAACGGDGQPIFGDNTGSTGGSSTAAAGSGSTAGTAVTTTTLDVIEVLASGDFEPPAGLVPSAVGTTDDAATDAIIAELVGQGIDLTGVEIWVLSITGTPDQMLVLTFEPSAQQVLEDEDSSLFKALADAVLPEFGIARFTINYYDSDADGDFVLTTTMAIDVFIDVIRNAEELAEDQVAIQFQRLDEGTP